MEIELSPWRLAQVNTPSPPFSQSSSDSFVIVQHDTAAAQQDRQRLQSAALQTTPSSTSNEDEWEVLRPKIAELYKENKLGKVMKIMEHDHKFIASKKMYDIRIRKWGIGRNVKRNEMKAIIRIQAQRSHAGKGSIFVLRNIEVPEQKIARCKRAMNLSEEEFLNLRAPTPAGLRCYTPSAPTLLVTIPIVLEIPERVMRTFRDYMHGSLDWGIWNMTDTESVIKANDPHCHLEQFQDGFLEVRRLFARGNSKNAWQLLDMTMAHIKHIVVEESPDIFDVLTYLASKLLQDSYHELLYSLLRHLSDMAKIKKAEGHPLHQLFSSLAKLELADLEQTLYRSLQAQLDCFSQRLGCFHYKTLDLKLTVLWLEGKNAAMATERYLRLLREVERAVGWSDPRAREIRFRLAWRYFHEKQYRKTIDTAQKLIESIGGTQETFSEQLAEAYYISAKAHAQLQDASNAEDNICKAILTRTHSYGAADTRALEFRSIFQEWLEEWVRKDEAIDMHHQVDSLLKWKYEVFRRQEEERFQKTVVSNA